MEISRTRRIIRPFDGEKNSNWKFRIRASIAEEDTTEWKKCERIGKGIIIEDLSGYVVGFASENNTASKIFKKVDSIYEQKNLVT